MVQTRAPDGAVSRPVIRAKIFFLHVTTRGTGCRDGGGWFGASAAVFALVPTLASTAEAKKERLQVLCESCRATLTELPMVDKTAKRQGRENAVSDAMEAICEDIAVLSHVRRILRLRCKRVPDHHGQATEEIETALWRGDENLVEFICGRPKGACHGVDMAEEAVNSKPTWRSSRLKTRGDDRRLLPPVSVINQLYSTLSGIHILRTLPLHLHL